MSGFLTAVALAKAVSRTRIRAANFRTTIAALFDYRGQSSGAPVMGEAMYMIPDIMYMRQGGTVAATSSVRNKHIRIDQAKLDRAKRVLAAATETEALDRALTLVVSEAAIDTTLRHVAGKGRLKKIFP